MKPEPKSVRTCKKCKPYLLCKPHQESEAKRLNTPRKMTECAMDGSTEVLLQNLADSVCEAFGNSIVDFFGGFQEIVRQMDHISSKEKTWARKYLQWDILTDMEMKIINQYRKQFKSHKGKYE